MHLQAQELTLPPRSIIFAQLGSVLQYIYISGGEFLSREHSSTVSLSDSDYSRSQEV